MEINELERSLRDTNERRYLEAKRLGKNPLPSHDPDHHERVFQKAVRLAELMGVPCDRMVLAGGAFAHDLPAYDPEATGEDYHEYEGSLAKEMLREAGFPESKLAAALYVVTHHGSDPEYREYDEPIEATILRDADKLEAFGPIGVARIIMARTIKGDSMWSIIDDFYTRGHLERKFQSITTDEARAWAEPGYSYGLNFFREWDHELGMEETTREAGPPENESIALDRDIDKGKIFGALGVARIIMARTLIGNDMKSIIDEFYTQGRLSQKFESITPDEARVLAEPGYNFSLGFFTGWARELGMEITDEQS